MKTEFMALWDGFATDREKIKSKIDFDCIAILCEGSTGSDLPEPCKKAAYFPIRDLLDEENKGGKSSVTIYLSSCCSMLSLVIL
ncbi:hypothetical protein NC653_028559 [Populus alba x Populus x berolinensis]|uniref:Uncharacterized protein n=1 Tax=Populus alba x Populus x berolinensis TaxID=444605 RepID=A0AAD6Q491_9ROSI|nr:hypothetical protein NC653_028559 [Populus alba x Populus x berolinensis]